MNRVVHFEINSPDPDRASSFYSEAFGWSIEKWEGPQDYWLVTTGEDGTVGINGAIQQTREAPSTVNTIDVDSLDEALERVTAAGATVASPKTTIRGVGHAASCVDPTGVPFGLFQDDPNAG